MSKLIPDKELLEAYDRLKVAKQGLWGMGCFNGLSEEQQHKVVHDGYLPFPWVPEGDGCLNPAEVEVFTKWDQFPGPRFYCAKCAIKYLEEVSQ